MMERLADNPAVIVVADEGVSTTKITPLKPLAQGTDQQQQQPHSLLMDQSRLSPLSETPRDIGRVKKVAGHGGAGGEEGEDEDEGATSGVILIGIDSNDGTITDRTTMSESRRSSSFVDHRPSDTNDTDDEDDDDDDDDETVDIKENHKESNANHNNTHVRRSMSSSAADRPLFPVMLPDQRQSTSSTSSTSTTHSLHHSTSSPDSSQPHPQPRPLTPSRQSSSANRPETIPTTITSEETATAHSRRPSAAEFQKFRDQLHAPITQTFPVANLDWRLLPNPHHPKTKTEILRIERIYTPIELPSKTHVSDIRNYDVLIPRFSPAFPPLLRDLGITEGEWTQFVHRINRFCMDAFDPFRFSNILVNLIHFLTLWMSELILPNLTKKKLLQLEKYIDEVNKGPWREKGIQIISLRRTAYLNIDIEIQNSFLNTESHKSGSSVSGQGTWDNATSIGTATANRTRSGTGVNSRTSLVEKPTGMNAV